RRFGGERPGFSSHLCGPSTRFGACGSAAAHPRSLVIAFGSSEANLHFARRWRIELSGGGRGARNFRRHRHEPALLCSPEITRLFGPTDRRMNERRMDEDFESPVSPRDPAGPSMEELAAFVDGELSADDWTRVQDWLANH